MVCCAILAALLGLIGRPCLALRPNPLAWRPSKESTTKAPPLRAAGRLQSFGHAFAGLRFLIQNEPNMRIHLAVAGVTTVAAIWLRVDFSEWRWLILAMALVLAAEAMNTAIEQACNAVTDSYNPAIKAAKDVAAGAVLITAIAATLIGTSIFLPRLAQQLSGENGLPSISFCHGER